MMHDNIQAERERERLEEDKCPPHVQIDAFDAHTERQEEFRPSESELLRRFVSLRSVREQLLQTRGLRERERERERETWLLLLLVTLTRPAIWHSSMCSSYPRGATPSLLMAEWSFHVGIQQGLNQCKIDTCQNSMEKIVSL
jgi:hypothetical protein